MSVIWGSSKSDFRLRIYDKTLERQVKGSVDADKIPKTWVRCEFQLRNDAAAYLHPQLAIKRQHRAYLHGDYEKISCCMSPSTTARTVTVQRLRHGGRGCWGRQQIRMAYDAGKDYNFDSLKRYIPSGGQQYKSVLAIMDGDFGPLLQGVRMAALNDRQTELIRSAQERRREWQQRQIEYNKM